MSLHFLRKPRSALNIFCCGLSLLTMTAFLSPATKDSNKPNLFMSVWQGDISLSQTDVMRLSSLLLMMSFQQQVNNKQRLNIVKKTLRNLSLSNTEKCQ